MTYYFKIINSPVGKLRLIATDEALVFLGWERENQSYPPNLSENNNHPILLETEKQLTEYFNRKRKDFTIKLDFEGTDFQKKVWNALLSIPYGETTTYGQIAKQLGDPKASQAVGAANGKNPIAIIAPCHRVIGSSGKMVGFGGGLENKVLLLDLENPNVLQFR
jgi:methylated-DNA-[protein]-cysteine S-methyltransferase